MSHMFCMVILCYYVCRTGVCSVLRFVANLFSMLVFHCKLCCEQKHAKYFFRKRIKLFFVMIYSRLFFLAFIAVGISFGQNSETLSCGKFFHRVRRIGINMAGQLDIPIPTRGAVDNGIPVKLKFSRPVNYVMVCELEKL